ncbi:MAG: NAD(P)/FAD-dependent oxidoreductase [Dehalococcoidia bacterium]|nr:NAD(P)/FAD-dependent oxidoreductase [Dehalococcoidia bacterium]
MAHKYDVVVIGAGPAGIFSTLEVTSHSDLSVLVLEKGKDIEQRACPMKAHGVGCTYCSPCDLVSGWGGAGAFSDGKLTLSPEVGGHLTDYIGDPLTHELIRYADEVYVRFGASSRVYGTGDGVEAIKSRAAQADLKLIPVPIRHIGTEHCLEVSKALRDFLRDRAELRLNASAARVLVENGRVKGVLTSQGEEVLCDYLVIAPGREGADWLAREASRLGLRLTQNAVDLGVRVELPAAVMEDLTSVLYESKLEYFSKSFDDRVRTFCMCPFGEVTQEVTAGEDPVISVNGHSYADRKTDNTNFALLVSTTFTEPFKEPIAYGRYIARLANLLGGGVLVQRLGDLLQGHRSTPARLARGVVEPTLKEATPGDLSFVLPYRHLKNILEMLTALDRLAPGVASRHTLLYGVEVKFYSSSLELTPDLETGINNMFTPGDGAGVTRGLIQSSASGVVVAREILRRAAAASPLKPRLRPTMARAERG